MVKSYSKFHNMQKKNLFLYNSKSFFFPVILSYLISLFIKEGRKSAGYKFIYKALLKLRYMLYSKPLSIWRFDANLLNNRAPVFYELCMKQHMSQTYVPRHIKFKTKPRICMIRSQLMSKKRFRIIPILNKTWQVVHDTIFYNFVYLPSLSKLENTQKFNFGIKLGWLSRSFISRSNNFYKTSFIKCLSYKYKIKTHTNRITIRPKSIIINNSKPLNRLNFLCSSYLKNHYNFFSFLRIIRKSNKNFNRFKSPLQHNMPTNVINAKGVVYFIRQTVHKRTKKWWRKKEKYKRLKSKFISLAKNRYSNNKAKLKAKKLFGKFIVIRRKRFNKRREHRFSKFRPINITKHKVKKNEWFRFLSDVNNPDIIYNNKFILNFENLSLEDSFIKSWDPDEDESELFTHPEIINQRKILRRPFFGIYVMKLYYNVSLSGLFNDLEDTFFPFEAYRGSKSYFNGPNKQMPFKVPTILYKGSARNISPPIDEAIYSFSSEYLNSKLFNHNIWEKKLIHTNWPTWKKSSMFSILTIIKEDISKLSLNKTNKPTPESVTNSIVLTVLNLLSKNHTAFKTLLQNRRVYTRQNLPFRDEDLFKSYF